MGILILFIGDNMIENAFWSAPGLLIVAFILSFFAVRILVGVTRWSLTRALAAWLYVVRWQRTTEHPQEFVSSGLSEYPVFGTETGLAHIGYVSPTTALATGRVRPRARWVRAAEVVCGKGRIGALIRGRWTPDLPSSKQSDVANYLLATVSGGAKVIGGGLKSVPSSFSKEDGLYIVLETQEGRSLCFPNLLGRLRSYSLFRDRDRLLLGSLRARAEEWCRSRGFDSWVTDLAVSSALELAWPVASHHRFARRCWETASANTLLSA
jgi:hypothetical protein